MFVALALAVAMEVVTVGPEYGYEAQAIIYTGDDYKDETFKYRLLKPAKIEEGRRYPLVLFLHGAGERGDNNTAQLQYLPILMATPANREKYPCFVVAPQCRNDKKWVEVEWGTKESQPMKAPSDQMNTVLAILHKTCADNPIDLDRVYLTGLSMGGYGSWDLAMRKPETFAAVAPICGGGDETKAATLKNVPVWAWHGEADNAVPVERSRNMIEAIKKAGGSPKYTELKGVGHNSWMPAYEDPQGVIPWMFEQKRGKK